MYSKPLNSCVQKIVCVGSSGHLHGGRSLRSSISFQFMEMRFIFIQLLSPSFVNYKSDRNTFLNALPPYNWRWLALQKISAVIWVRNRWTLSEICVSSSFMNWTFRSQKMLILALPYWWSCFALHGCGFLKNLNVGCHFNWQCLTLHTCKLEFQGCFIKNSNV